MPDPAIDDSAPRPQQPAPRHARGSAWRAFWRPGRTQWLLAGVLALVGLAVTWQVRTLSEEPDYSGLRRSELVAILDDLTAESRRLESEIAGLERTREDLRTGADRQRAAEEEAAKRRERLGLLAGTLAAHGPGVRIVITDPQHKVGQSILLNAISELRDAGAEVIEFNDSVRLVAGSAVVGEGAELSVDGTVLKRPIIIDAIGDPHALSEAMRFRGGLVSEVADERIGGSVHIEADQPVTISAVRPLPSPSVARPA